ncbi:MAG: GHKL domain-containing protein [Winogradskyella sp.]|nr:GHKL domain-containing protein [Winogradskyella sp.]
MSSIAPISISTGKTIVFNLNNHGFLFLYSRKDNITSKDLNQLSPVIQKFAVHLKACRAFKEQEQLLHNLEVQNQELSDYAHMVSHDLKSPLRSIDALTSWLKEDYGELLNDTGKNQINTIRSSVEKMDTLINGILEYSTIGKTSVEIFDVDLNLLIDEILIMIQIPKNIDIEKSILPVVKGDKYRLQQLFQNLISNSIAYNDKEKGKIEIGVEDKDQFWEFYVKDNGKGIEEKYFEKIFKTFQKLENNQKSTGIGLSVVKKIVDLYGGDIWLTSELGKGTSFNFTLKKEPNGTA